MNSRTKNWALLALAVILTVTMVADDALAQRRGGSSTTTTSQPTRAQTWQRPPIELSATYGSMWGGNIQVFQGKFRMDTGSSYSIALDIPLHPAATIELIYIHQDGGLTYDWQGTTALTDMSVNFWHIGMIRGLTEGKVRPFVSTSIGATYINPTEDSFQIPGDPATYYLESTTKLSFTFGVGVKTFFGEAQRFGLRGSFKVLPTLYNTGGGIWFGTGGASAGVTGNAIWQWEAAIGLTVKLGK